MVLLAGGSMAACATSARPADPPVVAPTSASASASAAASAPASASASVPAASPSAAREFTPPQDEAGCRKCQGKWGPHGKAGIPSCACATSDGGKLCRTRSDCDDRCELPFDEGKLYDGVRCGPTGCTGGAPNTVIPAGKCTPFRDPFGCHAWIEQARGGDPDVREVRRMCVD
jgi:hypothetical protein